MSNLRHSLHTAFKSTAEMFMPVRSQSAIGEKGVLTPEEFVRAGDYLVSTCKTWSWEAGEPAKTKSYLPKDKQYLVTRNVPSFQRTAAVDAGGSGGERMVPGGDGDDEADEWVAPELASMASTARLGDDDDDLVDISADGLREEAAGAGPATGAGAATLPAAEEEDIPDIDELGIEDDEDEDDEAAVRMPSTAAVMAGSSGESAAVLRTRTYDLMISYDKYYQVPRLWLVGYSETGRTLTTSEVFEDVTEEHARKTITVDPFPHTSVTAASIHPCKHAHVMKKLGERMSEGGRQLTVDTYLVLFLKFIASIVPNIEYDYTLAASL